MQIGQLFQMIWTGQFSPVRRCSEVEQGQNAWSHRLEGSPFIMLHVMIAFVQCCGFQMFQETKSTCNLMSSPLKSSLGAGKSMYFFSHDQV